jgi:hypothetical protein
MNQPSPRDWERIARLANSDASPRDPFGGRGEHLRLPLDPTHAQPGSKEKFDVLQSRVQGDDPVQLFHPADPHLLEDTRLILLAYRVAKVDNGHNYARQLFEANSDEGRDEYFNETDSFLRALRFLSDRVASALQAYRLARLCWGDDAWAAVGPPHRVGVLRFPRPGKPFLRCLVFAEQPTWTECFLTAVKAHPTRRSASNYLTALIERLTEPDSRREAA